MSNPSRPPPLRLLERPLAALSVATQPLPPPPWPLRLVRWCRGRLDRAR